MKNSLGSDKSALFTVSYCHTGEIVDL